MNELDLEIDGIKVFTPRVFDDERGYLFESFRSAWLPGWLKQLDFAANVFKRSREFVEMPSLTARRCIKVSAFPGEPVGWIIDQVGPEMLVYASDYPHIDRQQFAGSVDWHTIVESESSRRAKCLKSRIP